MNQKSAFDNLQNRYEAILAVVPEIITEVNNNKEYTWMNKAGLEFFGPEAIGRQAAFYFEGEQDTYNTVKPVFEGAADCIYVESWQRRKDGQKRLLAWQCRTLKNDAGQVIGAISSARDITESRKAEKENIDSRRLLQRIIDLLPIRIFWKDKNLYYLGCNEAFAKDAGKSKPEDLIGKDDFQMGWREQADIYRADDKEVMRSRKEKLNFVEPQTTPSGDRIWLKTSKVPLIDPEGNEIGILGTYDDITERKNLEDELQRRLNEMEIFYKASVGREERIIELKQEVERLKDKLGR
jgi:PAS domain S-box-containing protein